MGLAPLLHAMHVVRPAEVVLVVGFLKPKLLTGRLAGFAAVALGTISLTLLIAMVWSEENTTVRALALSLSFYHWPLSSVGQ